MHKGQLKWKQGKSIDLMKSFTSINFIEHFKNSCGSTQKGEKYVNFTVHPILEISNTWQRQKLKPR